MEKARKEAAVIAAKKKQTDWKGLKKAMNACRGLSQDDDVMDNPLRRPGAADFLGKWDK